VAQVHKHGLDRAAQEFLGLLRTLGGAEDYGRRAADEQNDSLTIIGQVVDWFVGNVLSPSSFQIVSYVDVGGRADVLLADE
jgi:hypothetical protein